MFLKYSLPTIIWALVILVLMLLPGRHIPNIEKELFLSPDKLAHVFVFMVLTFLTIRSFKYQDKSIALKNYSVQFALIISAIYSLVLESLQFISSERTVDIYDAVANLGGCLLGYFVFKIIYSF